jgi:hypothetical protein
MESEADLGNRGNWMRWRGSKVCCDGFLFLIEIWHKGGIGEEAFTVTVQRRNERLLIERDKTGREEGFQFVVRQLKLEMPGG